MFVEHSYGDVFSREGIDLKTRELSACAGGRWFCDDGNPFARAHKRRFEGRREPRGDRRNADQSHPYSGYPATQRAIRITAEEFAKSGQSAQ